MLSLAVRLQTAAGAGLRCCCCRGTLVQSRRSSEHPARVCSASQELLRVNASCVCSGPNGAGARGGERDGLTPWGSAQRLLWGCHSCTRTGQNTSVCGENAVTPQAEMGQVQGGNRLDISQRETPGKSCLFCLLNLTFSC